MIFPIGDDNIKGGYKPIVSYLFIALNVLIFAFQYLQGPDLFGQYLYTFGAIPREIQVGDDLYTLLTSMFMHGSIMHLLGNMLFLWIFADNIEAVIGNVNFLVYYMIGGIVASLFHIVLSLDSPVPSVGASGAISAVMGTYMVMFPKSRVKMLVLIFFRAFYVPAIVFLGFWFAQQLFSGVGSLGDSAGGGVAWWAHIGGFIYGLGMGYLFKLKYGDRYDYTPNRA